VFTGRELAGRGTPASQARFADGRLVDVGRDRRRTSRPWRSPPNNRIYLFARSGTSGETQRPIPARGAGNYFGDELALSGGILAAQRGRIFILFYSFQYHELGWALPQNDPWSETALAQWTWPTAAKTYVLVPIPTCSTPKKTTAYANGIVKSLTPSRSTPPGSGCGCRVGPRYGGAAVPSQVAGTRHRAGSGRTLEYCRNSHFRHESLTGRRRDQ